MVNIVQYMDSFRILMNERVVTMRDLIRQLAELDYKFKQRYEQNQILDEVVEQLKNVIGKDSLMKKAENNDTPSLRYFTARFNNTFKIMQQLFPNIPEAHNKALLENGIDIYQIITTIRKFSNTGERLGSEYSKTLIECANDLKNKKTVDYISKSMAIERTSYTNMKAYANSLNSEIQNIFYPVSEYVVKFSTDDTDVGVEVVNIILASAIFAIYVSFFSDVESPLTKAAFELLLNEDLRGYLKKRSGGATKSTRDLINSIL